MTRIAVFIPTDERLRDKIWTGSGIVGSFFGGTKRLRLDFEGDRQLYESFEDRVRRAAERHLWEGSDGQRYPTSAMAYADPEAVERIGWWYADEEELEVTAPETLAPWLDSES